MKIIVSGMIAGVPYQGGATWAALQYLLGFRRLGHDAYFIEPIRANALRPAGATLAGSINASYFESIVKQFGLTGSGALLVENTRETLGLDYDKLAQVAADTEVLFNISGMLTDEALLNRIPRRVYLDLDPAFIQLWHMQGIDMHLAGHTHFVTVARAMGRPECRVPTCGREWITTFQPVVLEQWPSAEHICYKALTTVANWRGYGTIEHEGMFYGQKAHSLRQFVTLPKTSPVKFMPALAIHPGEQQDLAALRENGWELLDPAEVAGTPDAYRRFIQTSWAELGIAKSGYATARTGWFSDRSICYLASARPVIAQETGFSEYIPTGAGLFAFSNCADVLGAIAELVRDYAWHARSARALAEAFFDSDKVLNSLLEKVGFAA